MSNVFRRGNKWIGFVELPKDPETGKRRRQWFSGDRQQDVRREVTALQVAVDSGDFVKATKVTLSQYLDKWLVVYCTHLAATTKESYGHHIDKHIKPALGKMLIGDIKPMHIQEFYNKQTDKGINLKQQHAILRKALNDGVKNDLISKNPCLKVQIPPQKTFEPTVYTKEDFNKLLSTVKGTQDELAVVLAGMCGLRRGEILGMRWSDIDIKNNIMHVRMTAVVAGGRVIVKPPKNKSSIRSFVYPSKINDVLSRHRKVGNAYVLSKDGNPLNGGNYSHHFKALLNSHNLKHTRLHDLRHFTATMLLEMGVDVKIVSDILGHSSAHITQKIYQHVTHKMQEDAAAKLNSVMF